VGSLIEDKGSELGTNNRTADRYSAAVEELNEMGVHVNNEVDNEGEFPVFSLGALPRRNLTRCHIGQQGIGIGTQSD
jgi:hypothetical protein